MIFPKRQDFIPTITGLALNQSFTKEITREFHIAEIYIRLTAVVSGAIATATADGLLGLLKNVTLTVSDGSRTGNRVNISGRALLEYATQVMGTLDRNTIAAKDATAVATYTITYPIFFQMPQLADPIASVFLLPAPRFNSNPVLTIQLASQADIDSNGIPTFACSSITCDILVNRRQVGIPNWPTYETELVESPVAYASSGTNQLYELQVPGSYTGILFRAYTSAAARGDISTAGGEFKLQFLGTVLRRFHLLDLQNENDLSVYPSASAARFTGAYFLDFLTDSPGGGQVSEMGSVLDANLAAGSGARMQLLQDIAGGAGVQMKYVTHRVFGDLKALKLGK